ncbi:MAG TPA: AAA family ATPase, partial [Chloroflexota bacterium]
MPPISDTSSTTGTFRVWVIGPFAVERDGVPLEVARWQRRISGLFKLLVVSPRRRRTRDELLGLLWPDATEEAGGANLRLVVHRLRHALTAEGAVANEGPSPILVESGWVALNPAYIWETDLDRFSQLVTGETDDIASLEEAVALHRGEALESEAYEDWATPYRDQVARQWRQACLRLAMLDRARGYSERAVEWLERLLEADPLDEEALRELLITLEALTRETEALRRFSRFKQLLADELDVPPDAETLAVAARVAEHLRQTEVAIPAAQGTSTPSIVPVVPSYPLSTTVSLIGRQQECELISELLGTEAPDGPRVLLLAAEAGIGKTRMLAEAAVRARQEGILTLAGGSYEQEGHLPYGPIHDALLDYMLAQPDNLLKTQLGEMMPELARIVPELRLHSIDPKPEWPGDAEGLRLRLFSTVAQALTRIAEDRPLLLLLDDLHWSDEGTLQLLHFLLRQTQLRRLFIIAAYRPEEVGSNMPLVQWLAEFEGEDATVMKMHSLTNLNATEIVALLEERLKGPCSETFGYALYERSAGNPFFALQILRMLQQEGRLEQATTGWQIGGASRAEVDGGTLLPVKVRRTVGRRLRKLSHHEHEALVIGAVLGREFAYAVIEGLWEGAKTDLLRALERAVDGFLLAETESGFAFRHPILREVVYDGISRRRRVELHRRAGFYLQSLVEVRDGRGIVQPSVQLAWHFLQGEEPESALTYAQMAGDQAQSAFAYHQAEKQYRTALNLARRLGDGPAECRVLEQLGQVLTALGHYGEAEAALEQVAAAYSSEKDLEGQRRVVAQLGQLHLKTGTLEQGMERVTGALRVLETASPSAGLGALYLALSSLSFRSGLYRETSQAAER